MNGINLKTISVASSTTTYTIPGNSTLYSNGIVKITESANSNIIFDVDTSSLRTKQSSSNKLSSDFITGLTNLNLMNGRTANGAALL